MMLMLMMVMVWILMVMMDSILVARVTLPERYHKNPQRQNGPTLLPLSMTRDHLAFHYHKTPGSKNHSNVNTDTSIRRQLFE